MIKDKGYTQNFLKPLSFILGTKKVHETGTPDSGGKMSSTLKPFKATTVSLATAYDNQSESGEIVIPETFEGMEDSAIAELYTQATEAFDALLEESQEEMTPEQLENLATLTEGIEALATEISAREADKAERAEKAAELASRVRSLSADTEDTDSGGEELSAEVEDESGDLEEENDGEETLSAETEDSPEPVAASGKPRSERRISLSNLKRNTPKLPTAPVAKGVKDVIHSTGDGTGYASGAGMDFLDIGHAIDRKLQGYNSGQFKSASQSGRHRKEQHAIASIKREFPEELQVTSTDRDHVERVMSYAANEARLPKGGLVASGGWCSPSETLYDLLEVETRDGLLSLPEIGLARGGINFTPGPSFADIFTNITGFSFDEQDDIDGKYQPGSDGNETGDKPFYHVDCPPFEETRLEVDGMAISAGLLMARGYPEVIARTVRGALVAHDHRVNGRQIARMVSGSDAITMNSDPIGATAPLLTAIELQATHYRYTHRLGENATLEAVFPYWVRGLIRSDLALRSGVNMLSIKDAQIAEWFADRQIAPQFVYNWQAIDTTSAANFKGWGSSVKFMLYQAGTWIRGLSDIITIDTLYDSTMLAQNDYTALFTEEGWLVAKRGHDSRVVEVPVCANGATSHAVLAECDGTMAELDGGGDNGNGGE